MTTRTQYEKSSEIGCFVKLTNTYCLIAADSPSSFQYVF